MIFEPHSIPNQDGNMIRCDRCGKRAIIFTRYSGLHLCENHFDEFFMKRVKREIRKQVDLKKVKTLVVALSGGKDSGSALLVLKRILGKIPALKIIALSINEGISGYRGASIEAAGLLCEMLKIEHMIVSFEDVIGLTIDEVTLLNTALTPCSYCGVWRKKCLNIAAKDMGADALVMGHNLDDMAQSILMNVFKAEVDRMLRMGPHRRIIPGFIPRIMPFKTIPEKETFIWAELNEIPFVEDSCPNSVTAHRGLFRDVLNMVERNTPGTRHRLLKTYETIYAMNDNRDLIPKLNKCTVCYEPTSGEKCQACLFQIEIKKMLQEAKAD